MTKQFDTSSYHHDGSFVYCSATDEGAIPLTGEDEGKFGKTVTPEELVALESFDIDEELEAVAENLATLNKIKVLHTKLRNGTLPQSKVMELRTITYNLIRSQLKTITRIDSE